MSKVYFRFSPFLFLLLFICFSISVYAQDSDVYHRFIHSMIEGDSELTEYADPGELALSQRLGISYKDIDNKFMISYEIDEQVIQGVLNKDIEYSTEVQELEDEYSLLTFYVEKLEYERKYYFKDEKLVSPVYYYSRDYTEYIGDYFVFRVQDPLGFNKYSMNKLEEFVENTLSRLEFDEEQKETLKREKIYYILCDNAEEIEKLTGYKTRGIYNLAYDYVITTYNCHYHEIVHLLANYKLRENSLYTIPFLQEGLAVALGGRGGKEPNVILDTGWYLSESDFIDYYSLLDFSGFHRNDASFSYPVSGLYNSFLLSQMTVDEYFELYKSFSGSYEQVLNMDVLNTYLPEESRWEGFLDSYQPTVLFDENMKGIPATAIYGDENFGYAVYDTLCFIQIKDKIILTPETEVKSRYKSEIFREILSDQNYNLEKYLIVAQDEEIRIYNLYSDNLIANYVSGLKLPYKLIPMSNGYYSFSVPSSLFDEPFNTLEFRYEAGNE